MLNLTQHTATPDQLTAGVIEPSAENKAKIKELLTFNTLEEANEVIQRADALATLAKQAGATSAMIGGAPYLMAALQDALINVQVYPWYAFTQRVVEEVHTENGVEKKAIFKHAGFVPGFAT